MTTLDQLKRAVAKQAADLRTQGLRAELPESGKRLQLATAIMLDRPRGDVGLQRLWRMAAICHCAKLAAHGKWAEADAAIPLRLSSSVPAPAPCTSEEEKLYAMMLVNKSVCRLMKTQLTADPIRDEALNRLFQIDSPMLRRWTGVMWMVNALDSTATATERQRQAVQALRFISNKRQPKLHTLAMRHRRLTLPRPLRIELVAGECVYYFNE